MSCAVIEPDPCSESRQKATRALALTDLPGEDQARGLSWRPATTRAEEVAAYKQVTGGGLGRSRRDAHTFVQAVESLRVVQH